MPIRHFARLAAVLGLACLGLFSAPAGRFVQHAQASNLRRTAIVQAVEDARPSVVNIHGRKTVRGGESAATSDSFRQVNGMGTGVVIDERGYVITNYHVVEGVSRIQVTLADQRQLSARLIAHDPRTDLAIIRLDVDETFPVIKIGTSSDLMTGEPVVAVGNAFGYEHTVTRGIISALHRPVQVSDEQSYEDLIQTDASINPGNSGGPLLNIDGEMIGINVAVRVGAQGIGFAIPIDQALEVAARLMSIERLEQVQHGLSVKSERKEDSIRCIVDSVSPGAPAAEAGLRPGDEIVSIAGTPIDRSLDVERALLGHAAGEEIAVEAIRNGEPLDVKMTLAALQHGGAKHPSVADQVWRTLGLKLQPIAQADFQSYGSRYRGGLRVQSVRAGGPADEQGIRAGDVLVGMHKWETVSLQNVQYVLGQFESDPEQPIKFFILRGSETLFGHLSVASRVAP